MLYGGTDPVDICKGNYPKVPNEYRDKFWCPELPKFKEKLKPIEITEYKLFKYISPKATDKDGDKIIIKVDKDTVPKFITF